MPGAPIHAEKPIALVGLMGAGKTTVGRRLAERLGLSFVDADAEIEAEVGLTIDEIFERFGEAEFRARERAVVARLVADGPGVIATGGGAFIDDATRALILKRCTTIWLDAGPDVLAGRVGRGTGRPLLGEKDPIAALRALAAARSPFYAEAHLKVPSGARSPERTVDRIVAALAAR